MNLLDQNEALERLKMAIGGYADGRAKDVARGAETPHLAALLVQKFGYGVAQAAAISYGSAASGAIMSEVDECVARIDPDWPEHARQRWAARPADVVEAVG